MPRAILFWSELIFYFLWEVEGFLMWAFNAQPLAVYDTSSLIQSLWRGREPHKEWMRSASWFSSSTQQTLGKLHNLSKVSHHKVTELGFHLCGFHTLHIPLLVTLSPNLQIRWVLGFPGGSDGKESACNAANPTSIPGLGRSEEGNGYPPNILAWRIPWTEEPGGLQFVGLQRVRHDWATNTLTFLYLPIPHLDQPQPTVYRLCTTFTICWWLNLQMWDPGIQRVIKGPEDLQNVVSIGGSGPNFPQILGDDYTPNRTTSGFRMPNSQNHQSPAPWFYFCLHNYSVN